MPNAGAALAVTFVSAIQLCACSSSTGLTTLDSGKTLSSLTTEERRQFCEDRFHYLSSRVSGDDRKKLNCAAAAGLVEMGGGATPQVRAACRAAYRACMSVPAPELESSCDTFPENAEGCAAMVGEASDCTEAQADTLAKLASRADSTCDDLGRTSKKERAAKSPPVCDRVQLLCPKLLEEPALDSVGAGKP